MQEKQLIELIGYLMTLYCFIMQTINFFIIRSSSSNQSWLNSISYLCFAKDNSFNIIFFIPVPPLKNI
jgi:hypothetical protein